MNKDKKERLLSMSDDEMKLFFAKECAHIAFKGLKVLRKAYIGLLKSEGLFNKKDILTVGKIRTINRVMGGAFLAETLSINYLQHTGYPIIDRSLIFPEFKETLEGLHKNQIDKIESSIKERK